MRILIIEDEHFAVERLQLLLSELAIPIEILAVLDSIKKAVKWLNHHTADLIFLDIHLADGNAFKIFEQVEIRTPIIFTTAYHDYALRAFEQHSIDYLLKPVSREKLKQSFSKLKSLQNTPQKVAKNSTAMNELIELLKPKGTKRFMVQIGNKMKILELAQIAYFVSDNKVTFAIHKVNNKRYPIESSIKQLELSLSANDFFRVNRQYLLSRACIAELYYLSKSQVKVKLKSPLSAEIIVSKEKIGQFKKWLVK